MPGRVRMTIRSGASIPTRNGLPEDAIVPMCQSPKIANALGLARRLPANDNGPLAESSAKAECAYATKLSSWALTPDGTRAFDLEKLGSLHDLVGCSGRGLERKGDWCVAQFERGKPYHWRIAASGADR